jgi:serine/threonine-protein kinase
VAIVIFQLDGVTYELNRECDLSFLRRYGKAFAVFDKTDSGNISFDVSGELGRFFVKIAGADTARSVVSAASAVESLKNAAPLYEALRHPALIELCEHYPHGGLYVAAFKWADGECLLDYWNFERYARTGERSPQQRFEALPIDKRLRSFGVVCDFMRTVAARGYVAIDFYDGSVMYDFESDTTTICDIDFYAKRPYVNRMGKMWGSSRFLSPEECTRGATLDETTNVFTLGATAFVLFGGTSGFFGSGDREPSRWQAGPARYNAALKAVSPDKKDRFQSISEFADAWERAT